MWKKDDPINGFKSFCHCGNSWCQHPTNRSTLSHTAMLCVKPKTQNTHMKVRLLNCTDAWQEEPYWSPCSYPCGEEWLDQNQTMYKIVLLLNV